MTAKAALSDGSRREARLQVRTEWAGEGDGFLRTVLFRLPIPETSKDVKKVGGW